MSNGILKVLLAATVVSIIAGSAVLAQTTGPEKITVQGVVSVETDGEGVVTAVMLTADDETVYNIKLDEKGLALGAEMEDKNVEVQGTLWEKDEAKWITVDSYKEIEKAKE